MIDKENIVINNTNNSFESAIENPKDDENVIGQEQRPHKITIIGTAHVSEKSVIEVKESIERELPDVVAIELCKGRYEALTSDMQEKEPSIKDMLNGNISFFLIHWLLSYLQKKMGEDMGVKPGAEMIEAVNSAKKHGVKIALIDRDIQITLQRLLSKMGLIEKLKMGFALIGAVFGFAKSENIDINNITEGNTVELLVNELRKISPTSVAVLIDERDTYMAHNIVQLSKTNNQMIVVVGAGHRAGIKKYIKYPDTIPDINAIKSVPKKRFNITKIIGFGMVGIIFSLFALMVLAGTPIDKLLLAAAWWFIINGVLSAFFAALAGGHTYSIITAFFVAWLTSINPLIAAGWFAGLVEAKMRKPTIKDYKKLSEIETLKDMWNNNLYRVILVAAFTNIGSMIGTFVGLYVMLEVTGIELQQIVDGLQNVLNLIKSLFT